MVTFHFIEKRPFGIVFARVIDKMTSIYRTTTFTRKSVVQVLVGLRRFSARSFVNSASCLSRTVSYSSSTFHITRAVLGTIDSHYLRKRSHSREFVLLWRGPRHCL